MGIAVDSMHELDFIRCVLLYRAVNAAAKRVVGCSFCPLRLHRISIYEIPVYVLGNELVITEVGWLQLWASKPV
jgi:hypothetical protein